MGEFADNSINLFVRAWCETENYWDVHFRVMEQIKPVMDENNLTIPYPQMDIHHQNPIKNGIKAAGTDLFLAYILFGGGFPIYTLLWKEQVK